MHMFVWQPSDCCSGCNAANRLLLQRPRGMQRSGHTRTSCSAAAAEGLVA